MPNTVTIADTADDVIVRLGDRFVSPAAAQLHIFGVLLSAHLGDVGYVPEADLATLPEDAVARLEELVDVRVWWPEGNGFRIDPDQAIRTIRESLDRLNDPECCVATGSTHVRGTDGTCTCCGATRV
jgi:hypothetical protein